jgi:hypothetical protein
VGRELLQSYLGPCKRSSLQRLNSDEAGRSFGDSRQSPQDVGVRRRRVGYTFFPLCPCRPSNHSIRVLLGCQTNANGVNQQSRLSSLNGVESRFDTRTSQKDISANRVFISLVPVYTTSGPEQFLPFHRNSMIANCSRANIALSRGESTYSAVMSTGVPPTQRDATALSTSLGCVIGVAAIFRPLLFNLAKVNLAWGASQWRMATGRLAGGDTSSWLLYPPQATQNAACGMQARAMSTNGSRAGRWNMELELL